MTVLALAALALGTYLYKLTGPVLLHERPLPAAVQRLAAALPAPLLVALVVVQTLGGGDGVVVDARLAGVAAAGVAVALRAPFLVVIAVGAVVTGVLRALA